MDGSAPPITLATAGHIDHGKTALVLALSGRDTDRLAAEKARGISIELGFAPLDLPSGRRVGLVDVPGHERFVRHMVAGVSGVDGYLLCVAADDGVMPQTREHAAVLDLLDIRQGVVAVTKADLMDPELAVAEVRELVGPDATVVAVSARTGAGMEDLRAALDLLAAGITRRTGHGPARLFVDRAFSVPGAGTVVTGTLWGGPIAAGEAVRVLPGNARGRVRGVQVHDRPAGAATGGRAALNLAGVARDEAPRGTCVVRADDDWRTTERLDVTMTLLADAGRSLRSRRRLEAFLGTAEVPATCVLLDRDALAPGERCYAQLRLGHAVAAVAGDRLVLRSAERRTVAGAIVIDPGPERHGRGSGAAARLVTIEHGSPREILALRLAEAGGTGIDPAGLDRDELAAVGAVTVGSGPAVAAELVHRAREVILAALDRGPIPMAGLSDRTGLGQAATDALVSGLIADGAVVVDGDELRRPDVEADPALERIAAILASAGLEPPAPGELRERTGLDPAQLTRLLGTLRHDGRAVLADDLWFDAGAVAAAVAAAQTALGAGPMSVAALRDLWGIGRRRALALAAHLDASGVTRRVGDERVLRGGAKDRR